MSKFGYKRNFSDSEKLNYILNQSHATIKSYFSDDLKSNIVSSNGISKNGTILKHKSDIY